MFNISKMFTVVAQIKTPDSPDASSGTEKILNFFVWLLDKAPIFFASVAVAFATLVIARILRNMVIKSLGKNNIDDQVVLLISKVSFIGTLVVGFTIALEILGIDISPLVGLVGLGVGFAMQDIIRNFVCGALILIQEPFKIGDVIKVNEYLGKVENIESRSTNIKTFDGQRVIIPNGDLFSSSVTNFSAHPERRLEVLVGVHYNTDLKEASKIINNILIDQVDILSNPAPAILFQEFGESSINISIKFWVDTNSNIFTIKSEVISSIKKAFEQARIEIPFPIRTLNIPDKKIDDLVNNKLDTKNEISSETVNKTQTEYRQQNTPTSEPPFTVESVD